MQFLRREEGRARMSDVLVKGMEMPKGCFECDLCEKVHFDGNEWHLGCLLLAKEVFDEGEKDKDCPLIEVKEAEVGDLYEVKKAYVTDKKIWMEVEHGLAD